MTSLRFCLCSVFLLFFFCLSSVFSSIFVLFVLSFLLSRSLRSVFSSSFRLTAYLASGFESDLLDSDVRIFPMGVFANVYCLSCSSIRVASQVLHLYTVRPSQWSQHVRGSRELRAHRLKTLKDERRQTDTLKDERRTDCRKFPLSSDAVDQMYIHQTICPCEWPSQQ